MKFNPVNKKQPPYGEEVVLYNCDDDWIKFGVLGHTDGTGDHYFDMDGAETKPTHFASKKDLPKTEQL